MLTGSPVLWDKRRMACALRGLAVAVCLLGCTGGSEQLPATYRRALEPVNEFSTADFDLVEIGSQMRPVLGSQPRIALRWREERELGPELRVETAFGDELPNDALAVVDTWVSARHPASRDLGLMALRTFDRRIRLRAEPQVVATRDGRVTSLLSVPEEVRGLTGLLSVVARPLPPEPRVRFEMPAFEIPPGARLSFGYGVEEEAWGAGWPPVLFRVTAEPAGSEATLVFERLLDPVHEPGDRRWFDSSLDLSAFAGTSVGFIFEGVAQVASPDASVARSLPVFANPEVVVATRMAGPADRRNVILISLDTLRARSVGAYGNPRDTTPTLDRRLAAEGARVQQAVVPFPFTPPSHMSMLTGLDVCRHGVRDRHGVLSADRPTLAELLRSKGYRTAAFTEDAYVVAMAGFARGFDVYVERRDDASATPGSAAETFGDAQRWLADSDGRPFFLFVHTYEVHDPYAPPPSHAHFFEHDLFREVPKARREQLRSYEREIRYTDDLLAELLDSLEANDLVDETIVVVTSDHGEGFGEHGIGHAFVAYDEALLVPLIIRAPGLIPPETVVEPQVGMVDLVPTLLDLLGIAAPPGLSGASFAGLLTQVADGFVERPIVAETVGGVSAVRTRRYKYLDHPKRPAQPVLYDLDADPLETRNVAAANVDTVAEAREALRRHQQACETWRREHPQEPGGSANGRREPGWLVNRDAIDEKLRALGYLAE